MSKSKYLLIPLALSISACSNNPPRSEIPEQQEGTFSTQIMPSGEKKFNLHIPMANQGGPRGGPRSSGGGAPPGGGGKNSPRPDEEHGSRGDRKQQQEEQLEQQLQDELYKSQYCHDGYKLRDIYIGFSFQVITGECIDLASDDDRIKFPNDKGEEIR